MMKLNVRTSVLLPDLCDHVSEQAPDRGHLVRADDDDVVPLGLERKSLVHTVAHVSPAHAADIWRQGRHSLRVQAR